MGMGVVLRHAAMGRPAGVADAEIAREMLLRDPLRKRGDPADRAELRYFIILDNGYACRIIAAVFMLRETLEYYLRRIPVSDIAHDSAHLSIILSPTAKHYLFYNIFTVNIEIMADKNKI